MTVAPEETSVRSSSDFLIMVDMYIEAKITRAQRDAFNFTSQESISIQTMYKAYMIPCLLAIKKMIEEVPEMLNDESLKKMIEEVPEMLNDESLKNINCDARYPCILLIASIEQKKEELGKIKQQSTNPTQIDGINLIQGVYTDIIEEIKYIPYKTK